MIPGSLNTPTLSNIGFIGILDQFQNAALGISTRRVASKYSGSAMRVRNGSNVEAEIPWSPILDARGNYSVSETALLSHCGAGSGFVVRQYDQSGAGMHAQNLTNATQPRIVNSGVVEKNPSSFISVRYTGANALYLPGGRAIFRNVGYAAIFSVYSRASTGDHTILAASTGVSTSSRISQVTSATNVLANVRRLDADALTNNSQPLGATYFQSTAEFQFSNNTYASYVNNVSNGSSTFPSGAGNTSNTDSQVDPVIGMNAAGGQAADGYLAETIVYTTSQIANRSAISLSQMSTYGLP